VFQDEARVGQKVGMLYLGLIGTRPPLVRDNRHDSAYLFGAICPTARRCRHLSRLQHRAMTCICARSGHGGPDAHASWSATVPDGSERPTPARAWQHHLINLRPTRRKLNPMENVWAYLRATSSATRLGQL